MKLVVFGTTGGVGREVVRQALEVGHTVTAVVRDPAKLSAQAEVVHSDLSAPDLDVLADTIRTADSRHLRSRAHRPHGCWHRRPRHRNDRRRDGDTGSEARCRHRTVQILPNMTQVMIS
jgi:NAD(P)-dependent dehydrogenase (short-subunit alcohol dehydrogenase family)